MTTRYETDRAGRLAAECDELITRIERLERQLLETTIERNELFDLILAADRRGRLRDVNVGGWHQQSGDCLRLLKRAAAERLGE